jgi:vacuolar protein sorting-associated protein 72
MKRYNLSRHSRAIQREKATFFPGHNFLLNRVVNFWNKLLEELISAICYTKPFEERFNFFKIFFIKFRNFKFFIYFLKIKKMSLVTERERRKNAGSKMAKLLNDEDDDEFYKSAYGGFNESEDDQEFVAKESDEEEDYVDSDFDLDEKEESDNEMDVDDVDETRKKKSSKKGAIKKAYSELNNMKKGNDQMEKKKPKAESYFDENKTSQRDNKSIRSSTARKREEMVLRREEIEAKKRSKMNKTVSIDQGEYRRLTQQELLEESKITEQINLASLDAYQKMELEKKKKNVNKTIIKGPIIRYHSVTMPLFNDRNRENQKQSRNFISFTDEKILQEIFYQPKQKPPGVKEKTCPITGLPAKYFDPLTQTPYANLFAFKTIREKYGNKA